jgi:hypothetical protein
MNTKSSATALKLLNLYRQEHVIIGGWAAVNQVFVAQANDDVIRELKNMPTGKSLVQHIENLRNGKTPMDSIERELLPYGGMMTDAMPSITLTDDEWRELKNAIEQFTPDQSGLDKLMSMPVVRKFGEEWQIAIRSVLGRQPQLLPKWDIVKQTYDAYRLWNTANEIVANPLSERVRAQVQADMPEYETYLPKFGVQGIELLEKLRTVISGLN